jgi:DNA-directed RNA polymerase subunit RPC12/RpoP
MKTIKQGKLPEEKEHVATCRKCGTEFSFLEKEGQMIFDQRDGNYITIKCPYCNIDCTFGI